MTTPLMLAAKFKIHTTVVIKYLLLSLLFIAPLVSSYAQISEHLYNSLPDSVRPQNRMHLKIGEVKKILDSTYKIDNWTKKEYSETDSLCLQFAAKYAAIPVEADRRDYLYSICQYLSQGINYHSGKYSLRGGGKAYSYALNKVAMEYTNRFIDRYGAGPYFDGGMLSQILSNKANFFVQSEAYFDAYNTHLLALETARKHSKRHLAAKYNQLARFFEYFDRPEMTLVYCDSASEALSKSTALPSGEASLKAFIIRVRQIANFSLYTKTSDERFAGTIQTLHRASKAVVPQNKRFLSGSYILMSGIAYNHKQYNKTLAYLDSSAMVFSQSQLLDLWEMAMVYKALSLRKLGKISESTQVLAKLDLEDIKRPVVEQVLMQLYQDELDANNFKNALQYRNRLSSFREKRYKMDIEGKAIEMEHLFKVKQREQEISQLTALQSRNKTIFVFIILIVILIIFILVSRNKRSLTKTQTLLHQLATTTQVQIMHLELARQEERKMLGQNLHDSFSSALAGVKHQLELAALDSGDKVLKERLNAVSRQVGKIYEMSRSTSHDWYHGLNYRAGKSFADQIRSLADSALPDSYYQKHIIVEDDDLANVSHQLKIDLLHMIQELLTNIVKHARAKNVEILILIDSNSLILSIKDDGIGFRREKQQEASKGIGLRSLQEKVKSMQGSLEISSVGQGSSILINLPLNEF
jgi:signal transduction histidine kinase